MTITRAEAERMDFSDVAAGERLPPVTPGEVLREEFMAPHRVEPMALAAGLDMPVERVNAILDGSQAIEAEDAARLAAWFGASARFWTNLQAAHDADVAALVTEAVQPVSPETEDQRR